MQLPPASTPQGMMGPTSSRARCSHTRGRVECHRAPTGGRGAHGGPDVPSAFSPQPRGPAARRAGGEGETRRRPRSAASTSPDCCGRRRRVDDAEQEQRQPQRQRQRDCGRMRRGRVVVVAPGPGTGRGAGREGARLLETRPPKWWEGLDHARTLPHTFSLAPPSLFPGTDPLRAGARRGDP
eukprot:scaffold1280_cov379-Prasinococcus_capsulatus_cf.AAC.10